MNWVSVVTDAAKVAAPAISAVPGVSTSLFGVILQAVIAVEQAITGHKQGPAKKQAAKVIVKSQVPDADPAAVDKSIDHLVSSLNALAQPTATEK